MRILHFVFSFLLIVIYASELFAQCDGDNIFIGTIDNDWYVADNWSAGCVPNSPILGKITIASDCVINSGSYSFLTGLQINEGINFTNNSNSSFLFYGEVTGQGTYLGDLNILGDILPGDELPPSWQCGDLLNYEGQNYSTVQIGNQCWMAENLNVGIQIDGSMNQTNNAQIEKYCHDNHPLKCNDYGGYYQWNELMNYNNVEGSQGICPVGWHIPSDDEWKLLEINLGMSQMEADIIGYRGTNQGSKLAGNEALWYDGPLDQDINFGITNFNALPSGYRSINGGFYIDNINTEFWTSTQENGNSLLRHFEYTFAGIYRGMIPKEYGCNVRCIKD